MKKYLVLFLVAFMLFSLPVACQKPTKPTNPESPTASLPSSPTPSLSLPLPTPSPEPSPKNPKIGIALPTKSLQRWHDDGNNLKEEFEALGYDVDLQFGGDNDVPVQISQIENMISGGCNVLVIAAIDGGSLTTVLNDAKSKGIKVVAYDRLIMNTDAVDYYATFGNDQHVGVEQGLAIEAALDLKNVAGPFNIEFFMGDSEAINYKFRYDGVLSILQPYLDSGKLVCRSGQTDRWSVATNYIDYGYNGYKENVAARMEQLIATNDYGPGKTPLHAVVCAYDIIAQGVTDALLGAGFSAGPDFPVITGQDCDKTSVKNMIAGTQYMSVFKETRKLAERVKTMVVQILSGDTVKTTTTYNNGVRDVPSYECELDLVTKDNYRAILIDSGYYIEADLQ